MISVRVVPSLDEAIRHINHYGSHHTDPTSAPTGSRGAVRAV